MRGRDYEAYIKNEWLPLVKKADANGLIISRVRYGGEMGHYAAFTPVNDLTELDQPSKLTQVIGAETLNKVQQKLAGIVARSENRILRLRAELSVLPTPDAAAK